MAKLARESRPKAGAKEQSNRPANRHRTLSALEVGIIPKLGEPWLDLPDGQALANWNDADEVAYNQINRQAEKALMFRRTFDFIKDNRIIGDYHEFGCHRCRTFRMALTEARLHNMDRME